MHFATRAIHAAQPSDPLTGALIAPIYQTSTYEQDSPGVNLGFDYSRTNNPTRQRLEEVLAELEGVTHCAVFASGLAAEHAVLHAYLRPNDEVIVPIDVYGGTYRLLTRVFANFNLTVTPVDTTDLAAVRQAVSRRTRLVWLESPTNPRLIVSDIKAIADIAHEHGALVVVDNTFATPVFQQPFSLGADIVVHSVTKYLAGHSDLIQGAALARDAAIFEPIKFGHRGHVTRASCRHEGVLPGFRRHGVVRARGCSGRCDEVCVEPPVLCAWREPGRREVAGVPPGADDARVDSGGAASRAGPAGHADPAVAGHRTRRRLDRRPGRGTADRAREA
jgi:cystathionine beta-lyase/cystathionine gamma-synthase